MAEGHSEDAPLLGGADSISPSECSPERQPGGGDDEVGGGVGSRHWVTSAGGQSAAAELRQPWPPDTWVRGGAHLDTLHVPVPGGENGGGGPKLVRSQSSMDSGCECDAGDVEGSSNSSSSGGGGVVVVGSHDPSATSLSSHHHHHTHHLEAATTCCASSTTSSNSSSSSSSSNSSTPPHHHHLHHHHHHHHHHHPSSHNGGGSAPSSTHHDPAGFSPLSPSQPGGNNSGPPTPGPSSQVVVVVTPNAPLHAYAHIPDCDSPPPPVSANHQSCVCDIDGGIALGGADPRALALTHAAAAADPHTKVTFMIDDEDDDEDHDSCGVGGAGMNAIETASLSGSEPGEDFKEHLKHHAAASFPRVPSYSRTEYSDEIIIARIFQDRHHTDVPGVLSASSSTASMPMCRICHHPQGDGLDTLISPCRCAGTMQFIHQGCLNKWLEVKRSKKAPACELCNYQFHRHKKFRLNHWQLPSCSRADKILHSIFLVCLIIMAACATITIICFKQDRVLPKKYDDAELTKSEVVTLTCGVLFFVAFFVAMYVEVKARNTLYRLFTRFLYLNQTWHIAEYDRRKDSQFGHAPV